MKRNLLLLAGFALLTALPLFFHKPGQDAFPGADDQAKERIGEIAPDYRPWFEPLFEASSGTQNLFFTIQAAVGAGVLGYVIGRRRGRAEALRDKRAVSDQNTVRPGA